MPFWLIRGAPDAPAQERREARGEAGADGPWHEPGRGDGRLERELLPEEGLVEHRAGRETWTKVNLLGGTIADRSSRCPRPVVARFRV